MNNTNKNKPVFIAPYPDGINEAHYIPDNTKVKNTTFNPLHDPETNIYARVGGMINKKRGIQKKNKKSRRKNNNKKRKTRRVIHHLNKMHK